MNFSTSTQSLDKKYTLTSVISHRYCKKLAKRLPGQSKPSQSHTILPLPLFPGRLFKQKFVLQNIW